MWGKAPVVALAACALGLIGCGRSSLFGDNGDNNCPPGGHCIPGSPDLAGIPPGGGRDMTGIHPGGGDMTGIHPGGGDMGDGCGTTIPCTDPRCEGKPECITPGKEICNNGIDDNNNGLIDCDDPQCFNDPACIGLDGGVDLGGGCFDPSGNPLCNKPGCNTIPQCLHQTCMPEIEFGVVTPHNYDQTRTFDTRGAVAEFKICAFPGGTARVGEFTLTSVADVRLDFVQPMGAAHVVSINQAGFGQFCDQNQIFCLSAGEAPSSTHVFPQLGPGTYYVIVQSFPGTQGATSVRISTGRTMPENEYPNGCDNGIDDDGNGLIDCADYACVNAPNCVNQECRPDLNLGALVVGDAPQTADFDTRTTSNRFHPTCAGPSTGNDYVVRFTLHETAGVLVDWSQGAGADHVISIFHTPGPGTRCDGAGQMSCFYPSGASGGTVAFSPRPPGDYLFIFKSISPQTTGTMHISVSAFVNRQKEICDNGIDDDGNGLTDCQDPACFGIDGCKPPICTPDVNLGDFSWGTQKMTMLDITGGNTYYAARCAQGGGKNRVVRVNLLQPMGLGYSCNETGSQVMQLTQRLQPLDACDANPVNCADPSVLPFGCDFIMPNLQPGTYELVVQAFAAGQEGTVNLTLFGVEEKVIQTCTMPSDCQNPACFTSPYCQQFTCVPDKKAGLLPLDGSTTSTTVQTSGNGDKFKTDCSSQVGGQDADVDLTLPGNANLTIEWAQVGDHDFELYPNVNDAAACNAGMPVNCTRSLGQQTGKYTLTNVPPGKYHLVVDADRPGSEGGVVLQLSGVPAQ
jgi:hypothetical protein